MNLYGGSLLSPFLATVQTPDEDRHRLIRRASLHFPVSRAVLPAALAGVHARALFVGPLQHGCLPLELLIGQLLPGLRKHLARGHERYAVSRELTLLEALDQS